MTGRDSIEAALRRTYAARQANNVAELVAIFAPGARYRVAGDPTVLPGLDAFAKSTIEEAMAALCESFPAERYEPVSIVIEGNKAMTLSRGTFRFAPTGERFSLDIANAWTFDADGRATEVVDFIDTALVAAVMTRG